ncbi:hypothetical protein [Alkalicoccobacillus murimartini]|nr:hypothetical protein [Alkalicoccobacillus murimartini]
MMDGIIMLLLSASLIAFYCIVQVEHVRKHRRVLIIHVVAVVVCLSCAGWLMIR